MMPNVVSKKNLIPVAGEVYRLDPVTGLKQWPGLRAGQEPKRRRRLTFRLGDLLVTVKLEVKWADMWIGAFWQKGEYDYLPQIQAYDLWICLVPCLPLHFHLTRRESHEEPD